LTSEIQRYVCQRTLSEAKGTKVTRSHSNGTAEPQSLTEMRFPPGRRVPLADGETGPMREQETETCNFNFDGILEPPHNFVWENVMRHSNACEMLARQAALKKAGPDWPTYFAQHRERLMNEASTLIARSRGLARWRLTRV
jgi:hypothetical protein